jgi:hypothetical protein
VAPPAGLLDSFPTTPAPSTAEAQPVRLRARARMPPKVRKFTARPGYRNLGAPHRMPSRSWAILAAGAFDRLFPAAPVALSSRYA